MEELFSCAYDHVGSLFGDSLTRSTKDLLASVYVYVVSAEEPKKILSNIKTFVALNDYVGFNKCLSNSRVSEVYKSSIKDVSLRDEFVSLGKDVLIMFADWRNSGKEIYRAVG